MSQPIVSLQCIRQWTEKRNGKINPRYHHENKIQCTGVYNSIEWNENNTQKKCIRRKEIKWFDTYLYKGSLSPSRYQSTMNTTSSRSNGSISQGNIACLPSTPRTDVIGTENIFEYILANNNYLLWNGFITKIHIIQNTDWITPVNSLIFIGHFLTREKYCLR